MFTTERTILRAYTPADLPILLSHINNPLMQSTLISEPIVPRNHRFAQKLEEVANEALLYVVIEEKESKAVLGAASISTVNLKNREVALGIGIAPEAWGKGYGTEVTRFVVDYAFKNLGVHRISLGVFSSNEAAVKLYKKIGFVEEGIKRKHNWYNGAWQDSIYMSLLEDEWSSLTQRDLPISKAP